ncbi:MAG TPA: polyprenol monophosphomannose synthase [Candidatus Krumholzibacteria bacterium]|jgi:dolichol-phosphate mannosyltransferase
MRSLVVIPTYNEAKNIARLVPEVLKQAADLHVLVVDDNSPDGTGARVDEMRTTEPRLHCLHREVKGGLGSAYIAGFQWALANTSAEFIFEMDADFSHDPNSIPTFLETIEDADLVVGSRYLHGITVINWPLSRLFLSVGANLYASIVTGLPLKDCTGGYKCFRRGTLEQLPLDRIKSDGYGFQIEVNYHAWRRGLRLLEIPIIFTDRVVGESKMSKRIIWEATWMVWRLRLLGGR